MRINHAIVSVRTHIYAPRYLYILYKFDEVLKRLRIVWA